jgi:hypothetical protein
MADENHRRYAFFRGTRILLDLGSNGLQKNRLAPGVEMRHTICIVVLPGMIGVTLLGLSLTPILCAG